MKRNHIAMATQVRRNTPAAARPRPAHSTAIATVDPATELMRSALGFQEIDFKIPESATLPEVEKYLTTVIQGAKRLQDAYDRIRPMIGTLLRAIRDRKLYRPNYKNITEYITSRVQGEWGFSRSLAFNCMAEVEAFPTADRALYNSSVLQLAAQVTDESKPDHKEILDTLSKMTVPEARKAIADIKKAQSGATPVQDTVMLAMRVIPDVKARWEGLLKTYDMSPSDLLTACMDDFDATQAEAEKQPMPVQQAATARR